MPSASAVSCSSSNAAGSSVDPRWITGPLPKRCRPSSFSLTSGWSVANVTSTTITRSGSSENAVVRAPANVISSCVTASAHTSAVASPASATSRAAS